MKRSTYLAKRLEELQRQSEIGVIGQENRARLEGQIQQVARDLHRARADEYEKQQSLGLN